MTVAITRHCIKYSPYNIYHSKRTFHSTSPTKCHYETLGLTKQASSDEIKNAYKRLAKEYHPDVNKSESSSFVEINEAYSILSDRIKKRRYDLSISKVNHSNYNHPQHPQHIHRHPTHHNHSDPYSTFASRHSRYSDNKSRKGNKPFWFFVGSLVALSYGSLWFTGKHFLTKQWDRIE